jgi:prepilin-type N-terminal cleavage/methylation domain-containing protein
MSTVGQNSADNGGFTLVEVLVSISIFLVVSLGIAGVLRNYLISERTNEGRASLDRVAQVISNRLTDEAFCSDRIGGKPFGEGPTFPISVDFSDIGLGQIPSPLNEPIKAFGLAIRKLYLVNSTIQRTPAGTTFYDTDGTNWNVMRASIALDAYVPNEKGRASTGLSLQERVVGSLLLVVNLAHTSIRKCISEARFREMQCAAVGKFYNPIGNFAPLPAPPLSYNDPAAVPIAAEKPDDDGCVSKQAFSGRAYRGDSVKGTPGGIGLPGIAYPGAPGPPGNPGN